MRLIVLYLLVMTLGGATALSEGEKTAISDLLKEWPFLGNLSPPWTSNSSEACIAPFKGIVCSDDFDQHIISLCLDGKNSSGVVPESIGGLFWLQTLTLEVVEVEGSLDSIGNLVNLVSLRVNIYSDWDHPLSAALSKLKHLTRLELALIRYTGGFPEEILLMNSLEYLALQGSVEDSFDGSVPAAFCDLDQLKSIRFSGTALRGFEICSGKLPNLEVLSLEFCLRMSLPLHSLLVGRPRLKFLSLYYTPIFGPLELEGQTSLERLRISGSGISGTLPDSLWDNNNLSHLNLENTKIAGTLPTSIGQLNMLQYLGISQTRITGTIPPQIGLCKSLLSINAIGARISGTLPAEMGYLPNLDSLDLSYTSIVGTIPASFNQLVSLREVYLYDCDLEGTIPQGLLSLPNLTSFAATSGHLTGTIPNEISPACKTLELGSNSLEGPIPSSALRHCSLVSLSRNHLSGDIGNLSTYPRLPELHVSRNNLSGSLPAISNASHLDFSFNRLSGTIPDHYRTKFINTIDLTNNQLEGEISVLIENEWLKEAKLGNNRFSGTISNSISERLEKLIISHNFLTGTIPPLPPMLQVFSASGNILSGTLSNLFARARPGMALKYLDLSHNLIEGTLPILSSSFSLRFLSLASNNLTGRVSMFIRSDALRSAQVMDLSNNLFDGQFPFDLISLTIRDLSLANNSFVGTIPPLTDFDELSILDISNNQIAFDASSLASNSFISHLTAQNNLIYGRLSLLDLPTLKNADFSNNNITEVDFESIRQLSHYASLNSISLKNNPIIISRGEFEQLIRDGVLTMSSTTTPSVKYQGVICSQLLIGNNDNTQFVYDESMFSFQQCQCDRDHFGLPPFDCHSCDTLKPGSTLCNGNLLHIEHNYYVYNDSKSLHTEMCGSQILKQHSRISNCLGLMINYDASSPIALKSESTSAGLTNEGSSVFPSNSQLSLQCRAGSTGRLCTRCICDMASIDNTCYFAGPAGICKKCGKVFSPNEFIPISLVVLIVVLVVLSIVFYLILASKRRSKELEWKNLSIGRRIIYRLIDATSFGQITIMVTFVQILVELTHWDAYALSGWLKVVNGESEGLGLRCLFPFLSNPTTMLVLRLVLPFIVIAIVCIGIGLGELIHRFRSYLKHQHHSGLVTDHGTTSDDHDDDISSTNTSLVQTDERPKSVPYPAMALATSTSISIVKFLYFGTTMSAVEYLFYSVQKGTNKKYVQSVPWMPFDDASVLRGVSIPFMIVYLFGIPFGFVLMSWKLRHKISSPFVRLYFGSLFENYNVGLFWWELVNVLRKLVVALLLRGLSDGDSFQSFFISLAVGLVAVVITSVRPWKRSIENFLDGLGSILLSLSLASNLVGSLVHSRQVLLIIVVIDGLYIGACLLMIGWRLIGDETSYEKQWKLKYGGFEVGGSTKHVTGTYGPPLLNNDVNLPGSEWQELS